MVVTFIGQINFSREPKKPRKPRQSRPLDPKHRRSISKGLVSYWDRKGRNKEEETSAKKSKGLSDRQIAIGTAFAAAGIGFALNKRFKITDKAVLKASELAYKRANSNSVNRVVNKALSSNLLSVKAKKDLENMTGASKVFLAKNLFSKRGYKLINTNSKNNFSTWQSTNGSLESIGSIGKNVLQFTSEREPGKFKNGFLHYGLSFKVNNSHNSSGNLTFQESKKLVSQTKAMYSDHVNRIPDNTLLSAIVNNRDNLGTKRQNIYERVGFKELPGLKSFDSELFGVKNLFALKEKGSLSKIEGTRIQEVLEMINN